MKKNNYLRLAHFMMCIFWLVLFKTLELWLFQRIPVIIRKLISYKNSIITRQLKLPVSLLVCLFFISFPILVKAQEFINDSILVRPTIDSLIQDTLKTNTSSSFLDAPVDYEATDSTIVDRPGEMVYLYGDGRVDYTDITLVADYIQLNLKTREVYATGLPDSSGVIVGKPVFTQGSESFECKTITYNFNSKKAMITGVISEQQGGYLHSEKTKKQADGSIDMKDGKYTTCDAENPHFYLALTKAKVMPNDKIVSGPAYLVVEDIPLPLILPFGFFPNQKTQASGILIPEYGEEKNRGFFLKNGGYYLALSDYFDLAVTGDVFSNGTWGMGVRSNYKVRYRFNGGLNIRYYKNVAGDLDLGTYTRSQDFSVRWSHRQDSKSNPSSSFSAQVNLSSSSYDKNHSFETENYLTNTKQSSISYTKKWTGTPFNFSGSLSHSQNSANKTMNLNFPKMAFNMSRINPFRKLSSSSKDKWYNNIELSYSSKMENRINTYDSLLFTPAVFDDMDNGFQHDIPLTVNFKPFNSFNISPRIKYKGVIYSERVEKEWDENFIDPETGQIKPTLVVDTIEGFQYAHAYLPSIGMSLNPRIYGMFQFKNPESRVVAIRHVLSPSLGFNFTPDMTKWSPNYYDTVQVDTTGRTSVYSYFENGIYGTPSLNGRSGSLTFSLSNNIEMKVRADSDSTTDFEKIKLLDNLRFSTSYNIFADSMNLAPISLSGYTTMFDSKFKINFSGSFDPYALDADGRRYNAFELGNSGKPFRLTRFNLGIDFSFRSREKEGGSQTTQTLATRDMDMGQDELMDSQMQETEEQVLPQTMSTMYPGYVDFNIPWSLSFRYNFNYSKPGFDSKITQTLNFNGNLKLTPKWQIGVTSGWDFEKNTLSYTSMNIFRDLHCWEMRLSWIPIGYHQSYSFTINAKASILKDLKYNKQKSWYDN